MDIGRESQEVLSPFFFHEKSPESETLSGDRFLFGFYEVLLT